MNERQKSPAPSYKQTEGSIIINKDAGDRTSTFFCRALSIPSHDGKYRELVFYELLK